MRRLVFGLGTAQVVLTAGMIGAIAYLWGNSPSAALVLGACLALSSTAIVTQLLIEKRRFSTIVGRSAFSVLLLQDLAVVPILFLVGVFGTVSVAGGIIAELALALGEAALAIVCIYGVGRLVLRPLFAAIARTQSREAFMAMILLVALGTAAITGAVGLSMVLGAFLAGVVIAETEFRHQIEIDIEPFKGLMLGLFFMSVGMGIDWRVLATDTFWILTSVIGLLALKGAINIILLLAWRFPLHRAVETGLLLAQAGEFAFIVVGLAISLELIPVDTGQFMLIVASISMVLTPALATLARYLASQIENSRLMLENGEGEDGREELAGHVVVAGFGRVGRMVAAILDREGVGYLAIDHDPTIFAEARTQGLPVRFGDATRFDMWRQARVNDAIAMVITLGEERATEALTRTLRSAAPNIPLYVRARDQAQSERLMQLGATAAVPETVEASYQLAAHVLDGCGLDEDSINRLIQISRQA